MNAEKATCRGCGAPIEWAKTEKGRNMPMDAEPTLTGTFVLVHTKVGEPPVARTQTPEELAIRENTKLPMAARTRATSHFATCSKAAEFRRKK